MKRQYDYGFKIVLVGNQKTQKTRLLYSLCGKQPSFLTPDIGIDFASKSLQIDEKIIKLQIWDTSGLERFRSIMPSYYKGAHGIILVYSINNRQSFKDIEKWMAEVVDHTDQNIFIVLVGNKCHLDNNRQVKYQQGKELANSLGIQFFETSTQEDNSNTILQTLASGIKSKVQDKIGEHTNKTSNVSKSNSQASKASTWANAVNFVKNAFTSETEASESSQLKQCKQRIIQLEQQLLKEKKAKQQAVDKLNTVTKASESRVKNLKKKNKQLMKQNLMFYQRIRKQEEQSAELSKLFQQITDKMELCVTKMSQHSIQ